MVSHRRQVFGEFVYECFRFFRRGFLDFARNDNVNERWAGAGTRVTFPFREIATSRVALLAMTRQYGCTLGFNNVNPY